eukprot:s5497_g6.t1
MDRQARMPLSARQNKSDSLAVSSGSQFCRPPGQLVRSASEDADPRRQAVMFRGKGVIIASEVLPLEGPSDRCCSAYHP